MPIFRIYSVPCVCLAAAILCPFALPQAVNAYDGAVYNAIGAQTPLLGWPGDLVVRANRYVLTPSRMEMVLAVENYGKADVESAVLLPFGPVTRAHRDNGAAFGDMETAPFSASALLAGQSLTGKAHRAASYAGISVTRDLEDAGLPVNPAFPDWKNPEATVLKTLRRTGTIGPWGPAWQMNVTWEWPVTFPAGKTVEVAVSYAPAFGTWIESFLEIGGELGIGIDAMPLSTLCLTKRQAERLRALYRNGNLPPEGEDFIIHDFTLTMTAPSVSVSSIGGLDFVIRPERDGDMVSACGGHFIEQEDGSLRWQEDIAHQPGEIRIFHLEREANRATRTP